jgi:hypothetical protein
VAFGRQALLKWRSHCILMLEVRQAALQIVRFPSVALVPTADVFDDDLVADLHATSDVSGSGWHAADAAGVRERARWRRRRPADCVAKLRLRSPANGDSVCVWRARREQRDDGASQSGSKAAVLFVRSR